MLYTFVDNCILRFISVDEYKQSRIQSLSISYNGKSFIVSLTYMFLHKSEFIIHLVLICYQKLLTHLNLWSFSKQPLGRVLCQ